MNRKDLESDTLLKLVELYRRLRKLEISQNFNGIDSDDLTDTLTNAECLIRFLDRVEITNA